MISKPLIKKASGLNEPFSREKLEESLKRSGAEGNVIDEIAEEIESWVYNEHLLMLERGVEGVPSKKVYSKAFNMLRKRTVSNAARYKLKSAMMELGPTGHPFEYFTGEIFKVLGNNVEVAKTLVGHCVTHEVDVIQRFIECKYYQSTGKNANVQVPLYIRSRVDDIIRVRKTRAEFNEFTFSGGVVTNTRFTSDAEAYGECSGLHLLSWDYPKGESLREIIDREKIFPITSLTSLNTAEKQKLMEGGFVICRQLKRDPAILKGLGLSDKKLRKVTQEIDDLCS